MMENSFVDLEDCHWLVGEDGRNWLERIQGDCQPVHRLASVLRKELSIPRTQLLLEHKELRKRATQKFPFAGEMFFTRRALEQSTDFWVARHKARRFPADREVTDMCCGIGGDLLGLAERGAVTGVDLNPVMALFANENAHAADVQMRVATKVQNVEDLLGEVDLWHIDPDRRPGGKRVSQLEHSLPDAIWIKELLKQHPSGAIKLAPGVRNEVLKAETVEWEFISRDGEVRQQVIYFGSLVQRAGVCTCSVLSRDGVLLGTFSAVKEEASYLSPPLAESMGRFLYEPEASITAAGLEAALAYEYGLGFTSAPRGYFTGDEEIVDPVMQRFEVIASMPFDRRRLKAWLKSRGIGRLEVKSREKSVEANRLQKELATHGEEAATLLITRFDGRAWAAVCRRPKS